MGFKCGIVGLPNVGKSTLFNALTSSTKAQAENFPFCTIDPNVGIVNVPDQRLDKISLISSSKKKIYTNITFVDIAGLVSGASKGEGLGNKFLSHIREVDAVIHVIRCFDSEKIQNVNKYVDPIRDIEIVETELLLADLDSLSRRLEKNKKKNLSKLELEILQKAFKIISSGSNPTILYQDYPQKVLKKIGLISLKPKIIICNIDEKSVPKGNKYSDAFKKKFSYEKVVLISADIEQQITELGFVEKKVFIKDSGISEIGLNNLIKAGYDILDLLTFFTSGPKETKAWTIKKNSKAPEAAGIIHSDFQKGFIKAETISYEDFIKYNGLEKCRLAGKMRLEGKDYIVKDGDIFLFRFNT